MKKLTIKQLICLMHNTRKIYGHILPKFTLADNTKISIQASKIHYCEPRENNVIWSKVEVMCETEEWLERFGTETDNVYGWVSVKDIVAYINDMGGIKE